MADTAVKEQAEATTESGGGNGKKMLFVGLFIGVAAVAAYFMLFAKPATPVDGEVPVPVEEVSPAEVVAFEVATMTVNLDSPDLRYARVQFGVVADALVEVDLTLRFPLLQDRALSTIAGFTPEELRTVEGHTRLRDALTADAQVVWPDGEVIRAVLYDLIVQ